MIRRVVCAFVLVVAASGQAADWSADLDLLRRELPKLHPNAFHARTREAFDAAIEKLKADAPSLPPHLVVGEIARLMASIGDGHTRLTLPVDPNAGFFLGHTSTPLPAGAALRFHHLPARFYRYADGLFVTDAANVALRGRRVLRLGRMSADEAIAAMLPFVAADNDSGRSLGVGEMLAIPEMLHAAGIAADATGVTIAVDGATATLTAVPFGAAAPWLPKPDPHKFRFSYRDGIVYAVIDEIGNEKDETLAAFAARLMTYLEGHRVDALVLDLRRNAGGNGGLNKALVHALIREPKFRQPGHLFVLIGRRTFSAATMLLNALERDTNAFYAGEPSGGRPNGWGDSRKLLLPSSGLTVRVSSLYWQPSDPRDGREAVGVEIEAPPTSSHPDAALDRVIDVVRRSRRHGTLDGRWSGMIIAEWQRIPIALVDGRLRIADLSAVSEPLSQSPHVRTTLKSANGLLTLDLRVGDGVIFGTLTTTDGLVFPLFLQQESAAPALGGGGGTPPSQPAGTPALR